MQKLSLLDLAFFLTDSDESPKGIAILMLLKKPAKANKNYVKKLFEQYRTHDTACKPFNLMFTFEGLKKLQWSEAENFNIDDHLFLHTPDKTLSREELISKATDLHTPKMDRSKPIWEYHLIDDVAGSKFGVLFRIHHAYVDGATFNNWVNKSYSKSPSSNNLLPIWTLSREPGPTDQNSKPGIIGSFIDAAKKQFTASKGLAKMLTQLGLESIGLTKNAISIPYRASGNTPLSGQVNSGRRQFVTASVPFDKVKQIGKATRSTVNHVALACIDQGMHRYLKAIDVDIDRPLTIQMPVDLRPKGTDSTGNKIGVVLVDLAKPAADIYERMKDIGYTLRNVRNQIDGIPAEAIEQYTIIAASVGELTELLKLNDIIPPQANAVVSNVPGPRKHLYLNDSKIEEINPLSLLPPGIHLNITIYSYAGTLIFGLIGTENLEKFHLLPKFIETAFVELEAAVFDNR